MRNLIQIIIRYHALFVFILLEIICCFLIVNENSFHNALFINSSNAVTGTVYNSQNSISEYFSLKKVNDSLALENAELRIVHADSFYSNIISLNDDTAQLYTYIPCKVIKNSTNRSQNHIYLNKGYADGIEHEMAIINQNGVVGIVVEVSRNFSVVMSMLHSDMRLGGKLEHNGYFGNVLWNGIDAKKGVLSDIPKHVRIKEGDKVITSGYSDFFPEGIPIGSVSEYELIEGTNFWDIKLDFATNFSNLKYVYAVDYKYKEQFKELENGFQ